MNNTAYNHWLHTQSEPNDSLKTTSYNHKSIGSIQKPLIPNADFKILVESLEAGDKDVLQIALSKFTLEPFQNQLAQSLHNKIK